MPPYGVVRCCATISACQIARHCARLAVSCATLSHVVSRPAPAVPTDCVHAKDSVAVDNPSVESRSEGIKRLKVLTLVKLVEALKIDMAIIFCRTNLDCDNLEKHAH